MVDRAQDIEDTALALSRKVQYNEDKLKELDKKTDELKATAMTAGKQRAKFGGAKK